MTSRNPTPDNFSDDSLDGDISHMLDDLSLEFKPVEFDEDFNDLTELTSLFDEDLSGSLDSEIKINSSKPSSLTSESPEEDIDQLFHNDFPWDGESSNWQTPSVSEEENLAALLEKNNHEWEQQSQDSDASFFDQLESAFDHAQQESDLADLRDLFDIQDSNTEIENSSPTHTPISLTSLLVSYLYPSFEALESLLAKPATDLSQDSLDEFTITRLAALINTPVSSPQSQLSKVTQPVITPSLVKSTLEDDFGDLEDLLEQADRTIGGPPTLSQPKGPASQSRFKTGQANVFEQNMRVPIRQLDNLSNLIGELVIKRNRLEQDQERLRQFLGSLLNQVAKLSDVGGRMQDLYERTLLEGALLASRNQSRLNSVSSSQNRPSVTTAKGNNGDEQGLDALEMDRFTGFHLLSQEMIELIVRVRESASDIQFLVDETEQVSRNLRQATTQLQEEMTTSRMVPFAQTSDRLFRPVMEISRKLNKQAKLQVEGKEVLVDKMIVDMLYDPMTHLINNALTHGIEEPSVRQQRGKSPEGNIRLRAFLQGNQTVLTVSDDGDGIDVERVKAKAVEKKLITPDIAQELSEVEIYDLLFHPGFSTQDKVNDFAGRGVGLDVVRTSLSEIRGSVTIDSTRGQGTTFTLRLPLTLSICKALCCMSDRARIAFPMDGVEDTKDYLPKDLMVDGEGRQQVFWNKQLLPVYPLTELLSHNRQLKRGSIYGTKRDEDTLSLVILRAAGNLFAIQVDQVLGEQEIVIKQIVGPVPKPFGIAGATVLGDGTIMPIGDVLELLEISQGRLRPDESNRLWKKLSPIADPLADEKTEPTVLIVDDSIVVRELLSLSFTKAGYRVEQARDGQEAWEKLSAGLPCDLVFCDIEMPRMNGLELLSSIQKDPELSKLSVALLTSRGADRHKKVAAKLGAAGYFIKPCPDQTLLDAAQRMLRGEVLLPGSLKKPKISSLVFQEQSRPTSPQEPLSKDRGKVLIIDDSVMVREMLSMSFTKGGYQVEQARDGQEAWEKLSTGLTCDLILCDIEMPRLNGLDLLSRLQEDKRLSAIPIAMITSRGAQKMQTIAAQRGAKGYFVKPYIEEVLLDAAKRLIGGEVLLKVNSPMKG